MSSNDILVEIPDKELSELAKMYLEYQNDLPQAYSTIIVGTIWKKSFGKELIKFYSPNNNWRKDGTFFCYMQFNCNDIFISTLSENNSGIYEGLMSSRIKYKNLLFFAIHYKTIPVITKFIIDNKFQKMFNYICPMFTISIQQAMEIKIDCPEEINIKQLDSSAAATINSVWPHRYEGSEEYLAQLIELNKGFGVFLKKDNKLVAWILQNGIGQMGILQTLDEYKRRGYGMLILKYMVKDLAKNGIQPFATILDNNIASKKMFEKLQFRFLGNSNYIKIK